MPGEVIFAGMGAVLTGPRARWGEGDAPLWGSGARMIGVSGAILILSPRLCSVWFCGCNW